MKPGGTPRRSRSALRDGQKSHGLVDVELINQTPSDSFDASGLCNSAETQELLVREMEAIIEVVGDGRGKNWLCFVLRIFE